MADAPLEYANLRESHQLFDAKVMPEAAVRRAKTVEELKEEYVGRVVGHFKTWIEDGFGHRNFYVTVKHHEVCIEVAPGLPCDIAGRIHAHNNTYFHYYLYTGEGHFQCTDQDCIDHENCRGKYAMENYRDDVFGIQELSLIHI